MSPGRGSVRGGAPCAGPWGREVKWLYLSVAILSEVSGSLALQAATAHPWWFVLVGVGYVVSFAAFSGALQRGVPVGVGYGIWSACGVAITAVAAAVLFGQALTPLMIVGIAVIIIGVLLVDLGSTSHSASERA